MAVSTIFAGMTSAATAKNSLGRRSMHIGAGALLIGAAPAAALLATSTADAATITVANTQDSGTGSLRAALLAASSGDTIDLTGLTGTINVASYLPISTNVTILGPGAADLTLSGGGHSTFAFIGSSGLTTISGLTLTAATDHGAISCNGHTNAALKLQDMVITGNSGSTGGGLYSLGCASLEIIDSTFSYNTTTLYGGGGIHVETTQPVTISGSTFDNNASTYYSSYSSGGGAYIETTSSVSITDSTFSNNSAYYQGGGAWVTSGDIVITDSTFSGNTAGENGAGGAGVYLDGVDTTGTATISNSTFEGNNGYQGGGIGAQSFDTFTITSSTISGNSTTYKGAGLYARSNSIDVYNTTIVDNAVGATGGGAVYVTGDMTMKFTTVNGNTTQNGIAGLYMHIGTDVIDSSIIVGNGTSPAQAMKTYRSNVTITQSLVGDYSDPNITTDGTDVTGVSDAGLGTLADNGGPTKTKALLASSPAIGLVTTLPGPFPGSLFDQRGTGYDRVTGNYADAGAFEYGSVAPTSSTSTSSTTASSTTTIDASTSTTIPSDNPTTDPTAAGGLPTTGTDSFPLMATGSALIILGGAGAAFAARRRQVFGHNAR